MATKRGAFVKDVIVTGAYGGMGRATTLMLRRRGYRVFAIDISVKDPEEGIIPIKADITKEDEVEAAIGIIRSLTDSVYAVIHFAGIYMLDSLVEMSADAFERIFRINLFGAFLVNKHARALMKDGSRVLITTSELAPLDPLPFTGIYAVSKAALDKYAYSLRMELQLLGISVSVLRAGAVDTGMLGASTDALDKFCENTRLYSPNASRFKSIVDSVEARRISTEALAHRAVSIIEKKRPRFAYSINRNPLLLLLDILPVRLQLFVIRQILKR